MLDLDRMLMKCRRDQWHVDDLDWNATPRPMSREEEMAVVQYFTDMAGIERLAGALFAEQGRKTDDPVLEEIFATFVVDEERHAQAAERLARFYDVHHYKTYELNPHLLRFRPHFINTIRHLTPEIANGYITTGELLLDIALLRSLDDFVDDEMSHRAMHLINRDESRHIAVDFHMTSYYCSEEYQRRLETMPRKPIGQKLAGWWSLACMLYYARPFLRDVFFAPMDLTDPTGKRMYEAFKRVQLVANRPEVARRPFTRFMRTIQDLINHPITGRLLGRPLLRIAGIDPRVVVQLYNEAEARQAQRMTMSELAEEALQVKYSAA